MNVVVASLAYGGSIVLWKPLAKASSIVLEQHDHYQKQTQRNRMHIHGANGALMLSIPVKHLGKKGYQHYNNVKIENSFPWQSQHWKSIESAYRSSPYFEFYEDEIGSLYHEKHETLYTFNTAMFELLFRLLGLEATVSHTKSYEQKHEALDIRKRIDQKEHDDTNAIKYTQVFEDKNGFISNLSILDLLFNEGPQSLGLLKKASN